MTRAGASAELAALGRLPGVPDGARVVVAMSGGVDSSVVAGLLRAAGYDVVGITLQLYDHGVATHRKGACCAGQDIHDARRVAEHLAIPHYVLDYEQRFRQDVMEGFAASYIAGETPIPCVKCNQTVKFGGLLETAREIGAAVMATGHYVDFRLEADGPALYRPVDLERDQSYFLFTTRRSELERLRFPLGRLAKRDVRRIAAQLGLPVAEKADSQDICFVPEGRYTDVIERLKPGAAAPGIVRHVDGRELGRHSGIVNFTIGQRRGLGIASKEALYVVRLDAVRGEVIVGPRDCLIVRSIVLKDVNWLGAGNPPDARPGASLAVRLRSSQPPRAAKLTCAGRCGLVVLEEGESGVAPGQACVFYERANGSARVLGGGWIAGTSSLADWNFETGTEPGPSAGLEGKGQPARSFGPRNGVARS